MRLIDADELTDFISEHAEQIQYAIEHKDMGMLESLIKQIPTAYDVDKVVEELEEYSNADEAERHGTIPVIELDDAIEIVKGGGIDG